MAKPITTYKSIQDLQLDLKNYRTAKQPDEIHAVQAMIFSSSKRFEALMKSLLDDGYLPVENVVVLNTGTEEQPQLIVKEGNRRVAALKIIQGDISLDELSLSDVNKGRIKNLTSEWKAANTEVPCTIYPNTQAAVVARIVRLIHGKGEDAAREPWKALARARENQDANPNKELGLRLLDKYLEHGQNVSPMLAGLWGANYSVTILDEALRLFSPRFGASKSADLVQSYPAIQYRDALENLIYDIGNDQVSFDDIRDKQNDFLAKYGVPQTGHQDNTSDANGSGGTDPNGSGGTDPNGSGGTDPNGSGGTDPNGSGGTDPNGSGGTGTKSTKGKGKRAAVASNDPRVVKKLLQKFRPTGSGRDKVVALRREALELNINRNPLAFSFVLRSMFEISAKAYADDHSATVGSSLKKEQSLVNLLRGITNHLTKNNADDEMVKVLHGAMAELGKPEGLLSVKSMNQLVHNPTFSIQPSDISIMFGNIFPLLEAMNS